MLAMPAHYPHVRVTGSARERGRQVGVQAQERVLATLDLYRRVFAHYAGWDWTQVVDHGARYRPAIEAAHPDVLDEMAGIADGAGVRPDDILAVNVRTEILFAAVARRAAAPRECTSFAVLPSGTAGGHTLLGQSWDWKPGCVDTAIVLEADPDDVPRYVTVVEAGLLAKTGMNEHGIGVCANSLASDLDRGEPALPYHVILRAILGSTTMTDALDTVQRHPRASSANYLVASSEGLAVDIETAPGDHANVWLGWPDPDHLVHTNHFLCATGRKDVMRWYCPDSPFRHWRASALLAEVRGRAHPGQLQALLRDHVNAPAGICSHPDPAAPELERDMTVAAVVYDLDTRTMWIADGQPCEHEFRRLEYGTFLRGR
jgi:isopenicillin-N N-acyltransferase-like protein